MAALKAAVFLLSLLPLGLLAWGFWHEDLGANPIETITRKTGTWTFNFLLITLCISPLRESTGWSVLIRLRRMLGLFAFFYACLHFTTYLWLDQFFDWTAILKDIGKRPFITAGFAAFLLLIPLALSSPQPVMRRLGGRRWQRLHQAIYLIALIACAHYFWLVKPVALPYPASYTLVTGILLAWRVRRWRHKQIKHAGGTE